MSPHDKFDELRQRHVEAELAAPEWQFGNQSYGFLPDGGIAAIARSDGRDRLLRIARGGGVSTIELPYTEFTLANGCSVRIACSWNLNAGGDAVIEASFYGTQGGAQMRNENGSFFDFCVDLLKGRERERIVSPPDEWGGRAAAQWVAKLAAGERFAGSTTGLLETARVLDRLYGAERDLRRELGRLLQSRGRMPRPGAA